MNYQDLYDKIKTLELKVKLSNGKTEKAIKKTVLYLKIVYSLLAILIIQHLIIYFQ